MNGEYETGSGRALNLAGEQARILYMQAPISNATVFAIALLFYFVLSLQVESDLIGFWVFALYVSASIRLCLWYLRRSRPESLPAETWLRYYLIGCGLVGVSWSLIYPLIYIANDQMVSIVLLMLFFGVVGSAVVILSVCFPVFVVYTYPQVLVLIGTFLYFEDNTHSLLALAVLIYLVMTTLFTRNVNHSVLKSIALQVQNAALIDELSQEVSQREILVEQRTCELQRNNTELIREIGERERAQTALRQSEERFNLAMRGANDGLFDWNLLSNEIYYSPRWKSMLGYSDEELGNEFSSWEGLVDPIDRERSWGMLTEYINGHRDNFKMEFKLRHKDGHWVDVLSRAFLVRDDEGKAVRVVGTHVDITDKKNQEERILRQAHFDGLTHLPNRFLALDRLAQLIKEAGRTNSRVAVLFLDLDGFKRINDSLGHETGDHLLVQAAERLSAAVRDGDTVCRLGGDEFIVLLSGLSDAAAARPVAELLVSRFRSAFSVEGRELVVTASIGISVFPQDGSTPVELLRNADTAMYHSKEQGRSTYHYFTDTMNKDVSRRLAVEQQLYGALGRQEFSIYYQPIVNLHSGEIIGGEALLRWNNPVLGTVPPEEFIPIAEQTGSIMEIGHHVLIQSLSRLKQWQHIQDGAFKIAVNLSPRQFRDPGLTASIKQALQRYGVGAGSLELEITEGVLMNGHAYMDRALSALSALGVGIAMDDFGTGYSSLSYLRSYPFTVLKIDRSFVSELTVDPADRELVNAAILMAHGLGLRVIAEGVETAEQLEYLREHGCEFAQGYIFSKPVSAQAFSELLETAIVHPG